MKTWIKNLIYILPALLLIFACNPELDVPSSAPGSADFSNYIAVGNSLTAGYGDSGLYADGQMQSYPYMISQQIREISPIEFKQPDIPGNGSGYMYLTSLAPSFGVFEADDEWLNQLEGPFNNLGVPGIRLRDISFPGYGSSPQINPYFYRMLGGKAATTTYLDVVKESNPTFFTNWIGNNDVLGYATTGGSEGIDGGSFGIDGLTPVHEFGILYADLMNALTANAAKGIVATVPDVTSAPFFTTVPFMAIPLDAQTADLLMGMTGFGGYNTSLDALVGMSIITAEEAEKRKVYYSEGINPILIEDKDLDDLSTILGTINPALALYGQTRQSNGNDILLLTAQFEIGELADPNNPLSQIGIVVPLGDKFALTPEEITNIETFTNAYNQIIRGYASAGNIGVFESTDALNDLSSGVYIDGVSMDGSFITGGAFSLDGIHPTPRGYAYVANKIIEVINSEFGASLSPVILNTHRAVILP